MADHEHEHEEGGHAPVPTWLIGVIAVIVVFFFAYILLYLRPPATSPTKF